MLLCSGPLACEYQKRTPRHTPASRDLPCAEKAQEALRTAARYLSRSPRRDRARRQISDHNLPDMLWDAACEGATPRRCLELGKVAPVDIWKPTREISGL